MATPAVIIPEIILFDYIKKLFRAIKLDYANAAESDSLLYSMLAVDEDGNKLEMNTYNYYEQAVKVFTDAQDIEVNIGYNMKVSNQPCVHILLPNETGDPMGIGANEGYVPADVVDNGKSYQEVFTNGQKATYHLMITSENASEVILIYNVLRMLLLATYQHLEFNGLKLPEFSGQDVNMQSDLVPTHIFHRSLNLSFKYDVSVKTIFQTKLVKSFTLKGTAVI